MRPFVLTASGRTVHLDDPSPDEIDFGDIAEHLSRLVRFNGAAGGYTVAQHSCAVMEQFEVGHPLRPYALLHDAHEAYIGDIVAPLAAALPREWRGALNHMKWKLDQAIYIAAGLNPLEARAQKFVIEHADRVVLATEKRDLLPQCEEWYLPVPPRAEPIGRVLPPRDARSEMLRWFVEYDFC